MSGKINKIKRILKKRNINHRDSDGGSSKSSNESNFMKDTSNIIKSTFINNNLKLNVSLPFNAENIKAISGKLNMDNKIFNKNFIDAKLVSRGERT